MGLFGSRFGLSWRRLGPFGGDLGVVVGLSWTVLKGKGLGAVLKPSWAAVPSPGRRAVLALGAVLRCPGVLLGRPGTSWDRPGRPWGRLGPSQAHPEAAPGECWVVFGLTWPCSGAVLETIKEGILDQNIGLCRLPGARTPKQSLENHICFNREQLSTPWGTLIGPMVTHIAVNVYFSNT